MLNWFKFFPQGAPLFATGVIILLTVAYGAGRMHGAASHAAEIATLTAQVQSVEAINAQFKTDLEAQRKSTALLAREALQKSQELGRVSADLEAKRQASRKAFAKQMEAFKATGDPVRDCEITAAVLRSAVKEN